MNEVIYNHRKTTIIKVALIISFWWIGLFLFPSQNYLETAKLFTMNFLFTPSSISLLISGIGIFIAVSASYQQLGFKDYLVKNFFFKYKTNTSKKIIIRLVCYTVILIIFYILSLLSKNIHMMLSFHFSLTLYACVLGELIGMTYFKKRD